jgi:hypothetical protein
MLSQQSRDALGRELEEALDGGRARVSRTEDAYLAAANWLFGASSDSILRYLAIGFPSDGRAAGQALVRAIAEYAAARMRLPGEARLIEVIDCVHRRDAALASEVMDLLRDGAIVVTSDRTAGLSILRELLDPGVATPIRRARVQIADGQAYTFPLLPAVRLSPGYLPMTSAVRRARGGRVIATDALTGETIAVVIPVLRGWIMHSSAHWWQDALVDESAVERRSLHTIPGYARVAERFPFVTAGAFHAALGMLAALSYGLAAISGCEEQWSDIVKAENAATDRARGDDESA